jgi:hypothetical protein
MRMVHSRPLAKNPTASLAGDQNGNVAPSVSASGRVVNPPNERIHSSALPPDPGIGVVVNAT